MALYQLIKTSAPQQTQDVHSNAGLMVANRLLCWPSLNPASV